MNLTLQYDRCCYPGANGIARSLARKRVTVIDYPTGGWRSATMGSIYLPHLRQTAAGEPGSDCREQAPGPILAYIAEQQKKLDMSRSAKAPRRRARRSYVQGRIDGTPGVALRDLEASRDALREAGINPTHRKRLSCSHE